MRSRILVIDDDVLPDLPLEAVQARTPAEAVEALSGARWWDEVWFDHDLGAAGDTMEVVGWLEQQRELGRGPQIERVFVHSMNPAGADRLFAALRQMYPTRRVPLPFRRVVG